MTWSLQLTLWALPPILAILLAIRDAGFLWPRRRELGTRALLSLAAAVAVWAILDLVTAVSPAREVQRVATELEYLPASVVPALWAWFALAHAHRRHELTRWPMVALYAVSAAVAGAALAPRSSTLFILEARLATLGPIVGLEVTHGPLHWVSVLLRTGVVSAATWLVSRQLATTPGSRGRTAIAGLAGVLALVPPFVPLLAHPGAEWMDLSSTGYALAGSLLVWGLMRPRILNLGPVDSEVVLRELRDPLVVMDGRGQLVDVNRAAEIDLGLRAYGDVPLALGTLWATGPMPPEAPPPRIRLHDTQGVGRAFEVILTPLGDGTSRRSALLLRDVTARERMQRELESVNEELERLARTDPLTGLANRRHFMEVLEGEVDRAERYRRPLSVVLLDLDHFKKVNDTHGHAAGDDVLRGAAEVLRSVCRDADLAARLGGEELALLLPETDAAGATTVAERVRERIQARRHIAPSGTAFAVTASIGVATADESVRTGEALLHAADQALYAAKERGRNRVMGHDAESP